ncbi:unnamed protein product [Spodoptera exigua]|nr:unnamed protein product [Spodoptera exigua]
MSPFVIVFCVCLAACAQAASVSMFDLEAAEEHFERFIQDFNKQYTSEEEKQTRFTVFKENLKRANTFNAQSEHASFGAVEGQYAIKYGKLQEFSEQQTVDCDEDSMGCGGGLMTSAFSSMIEEGGLESESDYPYIAKSQSCQFQASKVAVELTGCINYNLKSQEKLKQLVATIGPISIAVKGAPFLTYKGGIISDDACNEGDVNHAILLVGYGTVFCVCLAACAQAASVPMFDLEDAEEHFERFIQDYNKQYTSEEEKQARFAIFRENLKKANTLNAQSEHTRFGAVEGQYAIKNGQLLEFSEQQTVDCDKGSGGCGGGLMTSAFSSMIELGGLESETDYPYVGQAQSCQFQASKAAVRLTGCNNYNIQSQERLKELVATVGPISIAVKSAGFHLYTGGVMNDQDCNTGEVNHAILLVGYGTENGMPYWLAKNSWDTVFGENGYIKFPRGDNYNSCGVMNQAMASPIIA